MTKPVRLVGLLLLILLLCIGFASANADLSVSSRANVPVGTTQTITVSIVNNDGTPPIGSIGFDILFDNTKIRNQSPNSVNPPTFAYTPIGDISPNNGNAATQPSLNKIRYAWSPIDGVSTLPGNSALFTINFTAIQAGTTSRVDVDPTSIAITDINAVPITVGIALNGTFSVAGLPEWIIPRFTNGTLPTSGQAPLNVNFDASASDAFGAVAGQYAWTFGDGGSATGFTTAHTYNTAGSWNVRLTITNTSGSNFTQKDGFVTTTAPPIPVPLPKFTGNPVSGLRPLTVTFDSSTSDVFGAATYNWSFGDSSLTNISFANPVHTYANAGVYDVALNITNSSGSNTTTKLGYITVQSPNVPFPRFTGSNLTGPFPLIVHFDSSASNALADIALTYLWNFGDGGTAITANATHTYTTAGPMTVSLQITNASGPNTTTKPSYIAVQTPNLPVPVIGSNVTSGSVPFTILFNSAGSSVVSPTLPYAWTFGDGGTATGTTPTYTYNTVGNFDVSLAITNASGTNTTTATQYITATQTVTETTGLPAGSTFNTSTNNVSVNLTGGGVTLSGANIILNNIGGFSTITLLTSGVTNTSGNLTGTVTGVQYKTPAMGAAMAGGQAYLTADMTAGCYNTSGSIDFQFLGTNANFDATFDAALGGMLNETFMVFNVTATNMGCLGSTTLNITIPEAVRERNGGRISIVWRHGTPQVTEVLTPTYVTSSGGYAIYTQVVSSFSSFGVAGVKATPSPPSPPSPPGPSGGGTAGGGAGSTTTTSTNSATMLISKEGQVLMTYLINTGQQASFTVPLGTKVLDKAGKALSTVSVSMLAEADVPAVPGGTTYTFAGFAVKCSPDGATFSPAASLKFTLTTKEWDAVLAKANGNSAYLSVKFYDAASASWVSVPTTVDPSARTVTGSVSHISTYGLFADTTAVTPVVIEATPTITAVPTTAALTVAPVKTTVAPPAPGGIPWMFIIGVVVVIVVVGGGAYYYLSKGKK